MERRIDSGYQGNLSAEEAAAAIASMSGIAADLRSADEEIAAGLTRPLSEVLEELRDLRAHNEILQELREQSDSQ